MYEIALCEDEQLFRTEQEKICRKILDKLNIEYNITLSAGSSDFLKAFEAQERRFDLILLDIVMDGMSGMELAHIIREADKETTIIFITSTNEYALSGYDVRALHYLMKPVDEQLLEKLIISDYEKKFRHRYIVLEDGMQKVRVPINDIIILETVGRKVAVTLLNKTEYGAGKLIKILELLPQDRFIQCHQSFAINLEYVKELKHQDVITVDNKIVPISRRYLKDVHRAFINSMNEK